ncbi:MORN repeat-containing protein [Nitzschia inconspicua]|uniref:MORN repeat-containing protein n=1 Tax=Nitzschia inconspicua TaxID=303405 RepID=A0A9K3K7K2_9STRA|nr:MORN repeat-containing protein [Nitzschia inconspicua]KAG7350754.1 MORN repeat-containing protein [Nitzschia inconspicua]
MNRQVDGGIVGAAPPLPKCFCNWKHCRTYQKAFREFKHPLFNGVIKLKFVKNDRKSLALKATVDRTLHVDAVKRNEWREADKELQCRYYVARHHFTEALIKQYLGDRRAWEWNEPLNMKQAKTFLWSLDRQDVYHSEDEAEDDEDEDSPTRYVQAPNVPKDQVRETLKRLKEESKQQKETPKSDDEELESIPTNQAVKAMKSPNKSSSVHTQSTLSTSITDTLKAFEDDLGNVKNGVSEIALAQKDEENKRLREELNECQKQLSMLHNMVNKLQVDIGSGEAAAGIGSGNKPSAKSKLRKKKKKKEEVSSEEEDYEVVESSTDEENDDDDEEEEEEEYEDWSNERDRPIESEDEDETISTFHVNGNANGSHSGRAGSRHSSAVRKGSVHSKRSLRRDSVHSRHSMHSRSRHSMRRDSIHSRRSMRGGMDDGASVMSRQSLQSISPSIKSLPREIQLMDDEEDSKGKDDYSFFDDSYRRHDDDARSEGSRSGASRSRKSIVSGGRSRGRNSRRPVGNAVNTKTKTGPNGRAGSAVPREIDLSGDEVEPDVTNVNVSTDTFFVTERQIVDPYGEKGVYSGALSKSTGMPNGNGRLEYEKEGRWYEGDWIHGRWTGYGRLSNGDGDFYEGGLKNDHKHGHGVMRFADGRVFEGEYIRGQMVNGKMTYQDGSVYEGAWVDGMRHGKGKCIFIDGSEYEGDFREGNFHGHGKMTWNDGGWYVGEWCDGEMHGRGKEIRPDGSERHDGEWARGQPIRSASDARRRRQQQQQRIVDAG